MTDLNVSIKLRTGRGRVLDGLAVVDSSRSSAGLLGGDGRHLFLSGLLCWVGYRQCNESREKKEVKSINAAMLAAKWLVTVRLVLRSIVTENNYGKIPQK